MIDNNKAYHNLKYSKTKNNHLLSDKSSLYIYPPNSKLPESIKVVPAVNSLEQDVVLQTDASQSFKSELLCLNNFDFLS